MGVRFFSTLAIVSCLASPGCNCSRMSAEVDSFAFTRCAQVDPPAPRRVRAGPLELELEERVLNVRGPAELPVAAFAGPVGARLTSAELGQLSASKAALLLYLGGLGDTPETAAANLSALASLRVPTLFIPGGADRLPVVQAAFEQLDEDSAAFLIHGSGLRELRIGQERFAVVPGAAQGRYTVDETGCGFTEDDLAELREALGPAADKNRTWLLAWNAPSGWGVTRGHAGTEVGSPLLAQLASDLGARGGLFAYPEAQAFLPGRAPGDASGLALVVPRLGRTGVLRANGGRLSSQVARVVIGPNGLRTGP